METDSWIKTDGCPRGGGWEMDEKDFIPFKVCQETIIHVSLLCFIQNHMSWVREPCSSEYSIFVSEKVVSESKNGNNNNKKA